MCMVLGTINGCRANEQHLGLAIQWQDKLA